MKANHKVNLLLRCLGTMVVGLLLCALVSGMVLATAFNYGEGVSPLKWPVGTADNPTVIKICIDEDSHKPPDRSALLKEGMERWNAELQNRGLKLEITIGNCTPVPAGTIHCHYGNAGDSLDMDAGDPNAPKLNGNKGLAGCGGGNGQITAGEILIKDNLPAATNAQKEYIRNLGAHEITHILGLADDGDGSVTDHSQGNTKADFNAHDRSEISTLYPVLGASDSKASGTQQSVVPHQYDWEFTYVGPEDGHVTLITLGVEPSVIDAVALPSGWVEFNPADPAHFLPEYPFYQNYMVDGHPVPAPWSPEGQPALAFRADSAAAALSVTNPVEVFSLIAKDDVLGEIPVWAGGEVQWLEGPIPEAPVAVGGTIIPTDKLVLITPWLIAAALIVVAGISLAVWNRRRGGERVS